MGRLVDLTHTFTDNMPVYPGDPCARLYQSMFVEKDGTSDHIINSGMHVGTHIDAPLHMIPGGAMICEIVIDHFTGSGHLIDARGQKEIHADLLSGHALNKGDIVLVRTDWDKKFREPDYFNDYPVIAQDFADALVAAKVSLLGLDTPSPDRDPFPIHKTLLPAGTLIIENLTNLEALEGARDFRVHAYPMKYKADAAPARVTAEIED